MSETFEKASKPHELFMFNLAVFHFFVPAILFGSERLWLIFSVPLFCSLAIITSIARQANKPEGKAELVQAHWQLAWKRSRYLLLAYAVSIVLFTLGYLILQTQPDENMKFIQLAVVGWLSLVPLSVAIVLLIILETSALAQARKGIMPDEMKL
ncbi:hypothetical protein [Methylophaga sp. OBS4]|uniref:hypothetical protein n=1 Tax=Methylophaga sp. OBS4 TaxID=2991935 RepID=UPI00225B4594|nr:hypothetical protein [Methylophaga sp. OBS4]MCX4188190.1 hypothetical protein [Methylophaga sp. OBS4]